MIDVGRYVIPTIRGGERLKVEIERIAAHDGNHLVITLVMGGKRTRLSKDDWDEMVQTVYDEYRELITT